MQRSAAAMGSSLFMALAPGTVAGPVPRWLTGLGTVCAWLPPPRSLGWARWSLAGGVGQPRRPFPGLRSGKGLRRASAPAAPRLSTSGSVGVNPACAATRWGPAVVDGHRGSGVAGVRPPARVSSMRSSSAAPTWAFATWYEAESRPGGAAPSGSDLLTGTRKAGAGMVAGRPPGARGSQKGDHDEPSQDWPTRYRSGLQAAGSCPLAREKVAHQAAETPRTPSAGILPMVEMDKQNVFDGPARSRWRLLAHVQGARPADSCNHSCSTRDWDAGRSSCSTGP